MSKKAVYEVNSDLRMLVGLRELQRNGAIRVSESKQIRMR